MPWKNAQGRIEGNLFFAIALKKCAYNLPIFPLKKPLKPGKLVIAPSLKKALKKEQKEKEPYIGPRKAGPVYSPTKGKMGIQQREGWER